MPPCRVIAHCPVGQRLRRIRDQALRVRLQADTEAVARRTRALLPVEREPSRGPGAVRGLSASGADRVPGRDRPATGSAQRRPRPSIEQPQEGVNTGDGAHGRPRRTRQSALPHGHGWWQALDRIQRRPPCSGHELLCVGREACGEASLPLGEEGLEGQGGLPRARDPCDRSQTPAGDPDVDVSEVVRPNAQESYLVRGRSRGPTQGLGETLWFTPENPAEDTTGDRARGRCDLFGGPCGDNQPPVGAAPRTQIHQVIRSLEHVQIVFDHEHGITCIHQALQGLQEAGHVCHVEPCGGLREYIQGPALGHPGQLGRQLDSLGLSAGERCRGLPQGEVVQAHLGHGIEDPAGPGLRGEELLPLRDGHVQHLPDVPPPQMNREGIATKASTPAIRAGNRHRAEEVHPQRPNPGPLTGLATPPRGVE